MPLHIDKRPATLEAFWGNEGIKDSIRSVFGRDDRPHATLFMGSSGCGKTTLARIVATMLGCDPEDVQEYNSSNTRGIDTIRVIAENAQYAPMSGKVKVYIMDECHAMTKDAQNAMLKLLEDTPKHVYFMLCTTDPEKLLTAIKTRCMKFEVKPLAPTLMSKLLQEVIVSEGIPIEEFSKEVISAIVKNAEGCPRQALLLLDSVIDIEDDAAALRAITEASPTEGDTLELFRLLLKPTYKGKWDDVRFILKGLNDLDAEKTRYGLLTWMSTVLLGGGAAGDQASAIIDLFTESFMYSSRAGFYNACYYACKI